MEKKDDGRKKNKGIKGVAGRKRIYGEPTKRVQIIMPVSKVLEIKKRIKEEILVYYLK